MTAESRKQKGETGGRSTALATGLLALIVLWLGLWAAKADERSSAYDYLVASVVKNTGRQPNQFTVQLTPTSPKANLTNRAAVLTLLNLGSNVIVRASSPVVAPGDPMNPMAPRLYPVLTRAQSMIYHSRTNR
jgi:hypothetical protein